MTRINSAIQVKCLTDERCKRCAWESLINELFTEETFRL